MLNADDNQPTGKSGERKRKPAQPGKKAAQRNRKAIAQQQEAEPDPAQAAPEQVSEPIAEPVKEPIGEAIDAELLKALSEPVHTPVAVEDHADDVATEPSPAGTASPADAAPVSPLSIANAYGDYSRKSLEQTRSFLERLAGVRSPAKAFELQSEFAREAFDTFMAESRKIRELHSELAKQRLKRFEGFVAGITERKR
ncbi:phasin family protein [Bradyrhizobium sp. NP1]|uniref:phasin family protein n=1 Tax=Bradyrhizobium sp. NP1 TaxID=3049772 RepID=UPI0025A637FA|nr:phasin family protein [Bradyrhizobium sp. NP1]WJR76199.1 phasin family protein [Bradyrhizobium sp. NP1]